MIDSNTVEVTSPLTPSLPRVHPLPAVRLRTRTLLVAAVVSAALVIRLHGLGAASFGEDEINKLRAVEAYDRGDISANAEHPMLMKLAIWASLHTTGAWHVAPETALRLPNAIVGAATAGVVFLIAEALFDATVGGWAALVWALDINAAAINRIGKEDTFLLFFLLLAAYWYERAKAVPRDDAARRDRWYLRSAAAFGLMLASKYMPHYFGLHTVFNFASSPDPNDKTPDKRWPFYVVMGLAFVTANVALLRPDTWRYLIGYAQGDTLRHTGYSFAQRLYVNTIGATPWGTPPTFYLAFFATKVPLAVLAAAIVGLVWTARHPSHRGATFIRVFLVLTLLPYSFVASKFLRYMLPVLAVIDIAAAVGIACVLRRFHGPARAGGSLVAVACAACVVVPSIAQQASVGPYYGLAQNAIGARLVPRGSMFPDDEIYDAGLREAVAVIASTASRDAVVCSDAPGVVAEYLAHDRRTDMRSCSISHDGVPMDAVQTWLVVQASHTYFENAAVIDAVRRRSQPWADVRIAGVSAVQVFRFR